MPITARAIKKLRHDRNRSEHNESVRRSLKALVKDVRKKPTKKGLSSAFQALDKAAKTRVIHKNTASRLKSRLSHLLAK